MVPRHTTKIVCRTPHISSTAQGMTHVTEDVGGRQCDASSVHCASPSHVSIKVIRSASSESLIKSLGVSELGAIDEQKRNKSFMPHMTMCRSNSQAAISAVSCTRLSCAVYACNRAISCSAHHNAGPVRTRKFSSEMQRIPEAPCIAPIGQASLCGTIGEGGSPRIGRYQMKKRSALLAT
jgi:hypothetical protein